MANTWALSLEDSVEAINAIEKFIEETKKYSKQLPDAIESIKEFKGNSKNKAVEVLERTTAEFNKICLNADALEDRVVYAKKMIEQEYGSDAFSKVQATQITNMQDKYSRPKATSF